VAGVDYVPGSGRQLLAKNASLELCDDAVACKPTRVTVTVKLDASNDATSSKCEVDTDSIAVRNQFCGSFFLPCLFYYYYYYYYYVYYDKKQHDLQHVCKRSQCNVSLR